ncbi:hypothetical protein PO869_01895 [[Ruminococcus] gnavus]|uniref:HTH cro/C1-type domain-containing protein n=1 Tax=Mediterraneibacter gnavus TaxID=33038 RepID=A0AAW6JW27_MEDGN|nr:hypothetical protein [Mediterraneibacter gnavus]MDC6138774.1 hypothetical protein [Mediterraneibacter gnavus]MDE1202340.1 hypothetical protein [Mediterraneibacter gnavus]
MANEKITITDRLRCDIIERRKSYGLSSYELSERTGNGHSKFWLQNIESGKTKKISKQDLLSLYMTMEGVDEEDYVTEHIEKILNQSVGDDSKEWYELINIYDDYSENYNEDSLMDELEELLEEEIVPQIRNSIFGMSINQKQAALSALKNFYYSLYTNSDLAFALINIPLFGVSVLDKKEYYEAINDLLAIGAKYNDLVIKNKSFETIQQWEEQDEYFKKLDQKTIYTALNNFKNILQELYNSIKSDDIDMFELVRKFNLDVSFMIERGQPNVLKHYLKSFHISTGKDFSTHIKECVRWFIGFEDEYKLPFIFDIIDENHLQDIYEFLNNYGNIYPTAK